MRRIEYADVKVGDVVSVVKREGDVEVARTGKVDRIEDVGIYGPYFVLYTKQNKVIGRSVERDVAVLYLKYPAAAAVERKVEPEDNVVLGEN